MSKFYTNLKQCLNEKDVENRYREMLSELFKGCILNSPGSVDGMLAYKNIVMLMEFKYNLDLKQKSNQVRIIIQMLYYIKQTSTKGDLIPNVLLMGDIDECVIFSTNVLEKYLKYELDWSIAPSQAFELNKELAIEMYKDDSLTFYVFDINEQFNLNDFRDQIHSVANQNGLIKSKITPINIEKIFDVFINNILKRKDKYNANELVKVFINLITNPYDNYIHPKNRNILVTPSGDIAVNGNHMLAFFLRFDDQYTIKEKEDLVAMCDRIITDYDRRKKGEFYTPTIWVDEAHKEISKVFGDDWKEKYVVWDPAWGTGNLTRDYNFKELYCSTINQSDLDIANQNNINDEAVKFQYDFLNDGVNDKGVYLDDKLPEGLKKAFEEGREVIVFMNPPYKKSSVYTGERVKTKLEEVNSHNINIEQLYIQFLYKILLYKQINNNIHICIYSPELYLTGEKQNKFRKMFLNNYEYTYSMLFNAGHFDSVSSNRWGILFSIWKSGVTNNHFAFSCDVKDVNDIYDIVVASNRVIYNLDNSRRIRMWIERDDKHTTVSSPCLSSALNIVESKYDDKMLPNSLGYFLNDTNDVYHSISGVSLFSSKFSANLSGYSILNSNFNKVVSLFTARKLVEATWINQKDTYMIPNTEHPDYEQYNNDAIIYSLFNNSSNQSSLRNITYKDKKYNIENQFFFMSNKELQDLALEHNFEELYKDTKQFSNDRFIYNKINETNLSQDAIDILNKAKELVTKSFQYRQMLHEEHPEYHLNAWDSGWYQIKLILKQYMKDDLKDFNIMYKQFAERLRPMVYEFGVLRK